LLLSLQATLHAVSGRAEGIGRDGTATVTVSGSGAEGYATLSGFPLVNGGVSGELTGSVRFSVPGGSKSCTGNVWSLAPAQ
jgi:hypothetical protein